ncbi:terpene synthase family protein [Legionella sp. CNM-1927-20]|uniref:terpene synthase family protein n=1 Tax=Legionella sp. CNM-1927-20 TaxID=3422221 RepID=UPI00403AEEE4
MVKLRTTLDHWLREYLKLNMGRDERLFTQFLPFGYAKTTLSCVNTSFYKQCQLTKWMIGALITLTDDFTDNPAFRSMSWVKGFIAAIQGGHQICLLSTKQQQALKLSCQLYEWIQQSLAQMTLQSRLIPLIEFDLQQYFLNMHFSTFLNSDPLLICKREYLWHAPHNMGIVIAGMVDLACSDHIEWHEMAAMREIFYCAQRSGHICNTLTTLNREIEEGCMSNEIQLRILHGNNGSEEDIIEFLQQERADLYQKIGDKFLRTFSTVDYVQGLQQLQTLHEEMQGVI